MARNATGQVVEPTGKQRSWAIRFRAYGKRHYVSLGRPEDGWDRRRAEDELANVLADVRRGIWQPPGQVTPVEPKQVPTFHEFASEWLANREPELRPKTIASYRWQLSHHLLPAFADLRVDAIGPEEIDRYKSAKLRGDLGPNQINKTLGTLGRILKAARRYGHLERNPLEDVDRLRRTRPNRPAMDPEQLPTLLDSAERLRPILATLAGAGLRNGEACALDWRDVNLASGTLTIRAAKTEAGVRRVDLPLPLREELSDHKARSAATAPSDPVFTNREGRRESVSNLGRRLKIVLRRADARLTELGLAPIGEAVTPYSFRRLYASLRFGLGDDPVYVAGQMGHADAGALSMSVYASALRRRDRLSGATLREFDRALQWAEMGRIEPEAPSDSYGTAAATTLETALQSRESATRPGSSAG